jgi:glycosyltransferase involved in cell wall biosynthesis
MTQPLINILTRTANRPKEFKKCIASIRAQKYQPFKLIIATDSPDTSMLYIVEHTEGLNREIITVQKTGVPYNWNFYCNDLKEQVTEGWFFYLDDDDSLSDPRALKRIAEHLTDATHGVICQFLRNGRPKPLSKYLVSKEIIQGKIGGSCIFLHHTHKNVANWDGNKAADFRFIKAISEKIPLKFFKTVVVKAGNNGRHGQ